MGDSGEGEGERLKEREREERKEREEKREREEERGKRSFLSRNEREARKCSSSSRWFEVFGRNSWRIDVLKLGALHSSSALCSRVDPKTRKGPLEKKETDAGERGGGGGEERWLL